MQIALLLIVTVTLGVALSKIKTLTEEVKSLKKRANDIERRFGNFRDKLAGDKRAQKKLGLKALSFKDSYRR